MYPQRKNLWLPLLKVLYDAGSSLTPPEAIERVAKYFPELTEEDKRYETENGKLRWSGHDVPWARYDLVKLGYMPNTRGVWKISEQGVAYLKAHWDEWAPAYSRSNSNPSDIHSAVPNHRPLAVPNEVKTMLQPTSRAPMSPRRFWWVNQGQSYAEERDGGYIWVPNQTRTEHELGHWTPVAEIKRDDVIVHYANKAIHALSVAQNNAEARENPHQITTGDAWEKNGWAVDLHYYDLPAPYANQDFSSTLTDLTTTQGPFDKNGNIKQGYLWEFTEAAFIILTSAPAFPWPTGIPLTRPTPSPSSSVASSARMRQLSSLSMDLWGRLQEKRLFFSPDIIEEYLLALQLRRFVLLTGISGTGKTQMAMAVAEHFSEERQDPVAPYMFDKQNSRWDLPARLRDFLPTLTPGSPVNMELIYPGGSGSCRIGVESTRPTVYITQWDGGFLDWFYATYRPGDHLLWGVLQEGNHYALRLVPPQTLLVAVRPDWTDPRALLGYFNPILDRYVPTPFLIHLLNAHQEWEVARQYSKTPRPFFIILDEMNLARVEHYFADFLSAMESEWALALHNGEVPASQKIPRELLVAPNVFFTGTVNIDETTHLFSPKVLDRAYVLQFNHINLEKYSTLHHTPSNSLRNPVLSIPTEHPNASDWDALLAYNEGLTRSLIELNALLDEEGHPFGYRIANEIARFILLAHDRAVPWPDEESLDRAIVAKILPKIHGSHAELAQLMEKLFGWALGINGAASFDQWQPTAEGLQHKSMAVVTPKFPRTATEIWRMERTLRLSGYASFIE